jgi:dipeptidyl-peptidase-4
MKPIYVLFFALTITSCTQVPEKKNAPTPKEAPPENSHASLVKVDLSLEEKADAAFLKEISDTRSYTLGRPSSVKFLPDGSKLLFLRATSEDSALSLYEFDLHTKEEKVLLTPEQLLKGAIESLSPEEKARRERMRVSSKGLTSYQISKSGAQILLSYSGSIYVFSLADRAVKEVATKQENNAPFDPKFSPDEEKVAFVRGDELWVTHLKSGETKQLTTGANEQKTHAQAEFVAQEEMDRSDGYWWSPDSTQLIYEEANAEGVEQLYLGDPANPSDIAPLVSYPRPGKKNVEVSLGIISLDGVSARAARSLDGQTRSTWLRWDQEKYPYLTRVLWSQNAPLSILVSSRDQRTFSLMTVEASGETKELLVEHDDAWLNLSMDYRWLMDGSGFLWPTEREGNWQLALYNKEGAFQKYLTPASLGFRSIKRLFNDKIIVTGGAEPINQSIYSISLTNGEISPITKDKGKFFDGTFGESGDYTLSESSLESFSIPSVYHANGEVIGQLSNVAKEPPVWPKVSIKKVGDGLGFYTALVKPSDFDKDKRYPVIVRVYGGPGVRTVYTSGASYILDQWIADHGFLVVKIDGRGTPDRGRAWERELYGKFSSVPLEDQVAGLLALAKEEPSLDLERVGIIGHSFGGYMAALSVLKRPDIYKAGVASAPVADWLDYDTFYTERYLGVPEKDTTLYDENGLLMYAKELSRPLLLIHGTADDNVHFSQTLKLSDALFRAGKDYEMVTLAGQTHMFRDVTDRYWQRVFAFFRKSL